MDQAIHRLTVLYDSACPICRFAREWLGGQAQLVPLEFVAAGSRAARERYPDLDHSAALRDVTVVADTGAVYTDDAAWLVCLWALDRYRALSFRLAAPALRDRAREVVHAAAALRRRTTARDYGYADDDCPGECRRSAAW
jgi:predicted DCC family thiol-disulfide oxidoreductase YuxK